MVGHIVFIPVQLRSLLRRVAFAPTNGISDGSRTRKLQILSLTHVPILLQRYDLGRTWMRILKSFQSPNGLPIHPDNGYNGTYCLNSFSFTPTPKFDQEVLGTYLVVTRRRLELLISCLRGKCDKTTSTNEPYWWHVRDLNPWILDWRSSELSLSSPTCHK